MRFIRRATLAALLIALLGQALLTVRPALAAPLSLYTLDATVEYDSGIVTARETLAFTNESSQTMQTLVFSVTPAYYGAFQLLLATVSGQEVAAALDKSILELPLPQVLPPGSSVVAALDFKLKIPRRSGRFGKGPQVIALGNWFPILAIHRDGRLLSKGQEAGWVRGQYVEAGDAFFSEASDFLVTIRTDRPMAVAHTGVLISQEENTWRFEARRVRDFALAISPTFATVSQSVEGVNVSVFFLPGHEAAAATYLRAAAEMLTWMKRTLVPYPYEHLDLAEINAQGSTLVGQEYPNLIFMSDGMAYGSGGVDSSAGILAL
ncbi:MAG: hypothetical protein Q8P59_03965, partial [Dehalococcoidia bacterium]|nr:hypothetical protein [Dehalococcoidia bacterium]